MPSGAWPSWWPRRGASIEFPGGLFYSLRVGWAVRVGVALGVASVAWGSVWGAEDPVRLEAVRFHHGGDSVAVVLHTDRACRPAVSTTDVASTGIRRVYLDFPAPATLGPAVPDTMPGAGGIRLVRAGIVEPGRVRVVVETAGGERPLLRRPPRGHGVAIVVPNPRASDRAAAGERQPPRRRARPLRVVLDPGHGGDDPGASGAVREKVVTLAIAHRLAALLRDRIGADVTLTRTGDESVSLAERTRRANAARGDLFVSIHANASARHAARGVETYYLDNTNDQATLRLASIENRRIGTATLERTSLDRILSSLVQGGKHQPSVDLAEHVQRGIVGRLRDEWPDVVDLGVKHGPFYVLMGAYMPCILVETSFLTHAEEGRRLATPGYQGALADGIFRGIAAFLEAQAQTGTL